MSRASQTERQLLGLAAFAFAAALPWALWHRAIALMASDFRFDPGYLLTGWLGYGLIALGLLCLLPVAWSAGRHPGSRLYPRMRNAYLGWGMSLYLMGFAVAAQVAAAL